MRLFSRSSRRARRHLAVDRSESRPLACGQRVRTLSVSVARPLPRPLVVLRHAHSRLTAHTVCAVGRAHRNEEVAVILFVVSEAASDPLGTAVVAGSALAGGVAGPTAALVAVNSAGFGAGGIVGGSWGAWLMSLGGGQTMSGGLVATLQSIGATGTLGLTGTAVAMGGGAVVAGGVGYVGYRLYKAYYVGGSNTSSTGTAAPETPSPIGNNPASGTPEKPSAPSPVPDEAAASSVAPRSTPDAADRPSTAATDGSAPASGSSPTLHPTAQQSQSTSPPLDADADHPLPAPENRRRSPPPYED